MSAFNNIKAVAKRELGGYFSSPVAYVFIVIFLLLNAFFTFTAGSFFERGQANLDAFFMWHPWLYLFLVPCVGMRLWAEERRVGTLELLLTKPITAWQAILGKFLASWLFLGLALALTFPVLITVNYLGSPDNGVIIAAYLGSLLMAGTYLAISSMTSAMSRNQVVSFILAVVICLFLVLCGFPPVTDLLTRLDRPWVVDLVSSLSVMTHFQPFTTGMIDSRDVIFFLLIIAFALFTNGVIIRSHRATSIDKLMKRNFETLLYSAGGVVAMFIVMVSLYIVTSAVKLRFDITADHVHTLSPGTRRILARLDSRVTLRFYCTQADVAMPPALKTYAHHVEDLLHEFQEQAHGHLLIQKLDPKPDSDVEDSARLDGIEGRPIGPYDSDKIYLGLVASLLDQKFALPWLAPDRERLLEYDIARAIARVVSTSRPVLGIMSGLPVFGQGFNPLMQPGQAPTQDWAFITELKKDFVIKEIPLSATNIDNDVNVLLVVHPVDVTDATQYALDQFVLRGGKLLAFLDPHAYFDQEHQASKSFSIAGDNAGRSSLDKLLHAWGLKMDVNEVLADKTFAGHNNQTGDSMPTLLLVTSEGLNPNDVVTSQIDNLFLPFAGVFTGKPARGLQETVLVKSSTDSMLVDTMMATLPADRILRHFKTSNTEYPLAVDLKGRFKTAFPAGPPHTPGGRASPRALKTQPQLQKSVGNAEVVLVGDTDLLNDKVSVRTDNVMGHRLLRPMNGNLTFVQSLVEEFAGDDDLIGARSRASLSRPFTRLKEMELAAAKQWEEKLHVLEDAQRDTQQHIKELQSYNGGPQNESQILTPAQEKEMEHYQKTLVEVGRSLKQVRKNLRLKTDALQFWTKVLNIATMPTLVAVFGLGLALLKARRRARREAARNRPHRPAPPTPGPGTPREAALA